MIAGKGRHNIIRFKHIINDEAGVSLIGTALVVLIAGMLVVPMYFTLFTVMRLGPNEDRLANVRYGIGEYYRVMGTLPCPAPLMASPDDTNYMIGNLNKTTGFCTGVIDTNPGNLNGAYIGAIPAKNLADIMDCRADVKDTSGDSVNTAGSRLEFIESLPTDLQNVLKRDLWQINEFEEDASGNATTDRAEKTKLIDGKCVTADMLLDEFGNKIVYAVSKYTVSLQHFKPDVTGHGTINIKKPNLTDNLTENGQWFALVSMGEDGKGAVNKEGIASGTPCGTIAAGFENENCDNDADFVMAPYSTATGAMHYDDYVDFSLDDALSEHSVWFWQAADDDVDDRDIRFLNNRRLVIDTTSDDTAIESNDLLYIGQGNVKVKDGGSGKADVMVGGAAYGEKFCYNDTAC